MDYATLLRNRRSIRDYLDREVDPSLLGEILEETCLAPTASNNQPVKFIVIRKKDLLKRLSDESRRNFLADLAGNPDSPMRRYEAVLRDESFNCFYNAPCVVYFIGPKSVRSLDVDIGLTAAYFMFGAAARGLGTCWIGMGANIRDGGLLAEIGVPGDCRIVAPIAIGYPEEIPAATERHAPEILKSV
ncbi:MAG: nitroreductase family protein [Syntrophaceae bacterium]|nr:nitroreductase family protein [Syntrophaceae bacterium]